MKTLFTTGLALILFAACSKKGGVIRPIPNPQPDPAMRYLNLADHSIPFNRSFQADLDGNGSYDFAITTTLVGSPADQSDYQCYYFSGSLFSYSPVDENEEMPVLAQGEKISDKAFPQHQWYNASHLLLSQRVIPMTGQPFWKGAWKDADHRYVAISLLKNGKYHYGWVELSFDSQQGTVILHRAAICEEASREVKAGL